MEIECLAHNVYFEASGESFQGKLAVAQVTMNRLNTTKKRNSVCNVVYEKRNKICQFSWVCSKGRKIKSIKAYEESKAAAYYAYYDLMRIEGIKDYLYFRRCCLYRKRKLVIGNHMFF